MHDAPIQLLLVEDDLLDRKSIHRAFRLSGVAVKIVDASTLTEARALLQQHRFHCVVVDHNLPDGEGLDLIHEVNIWPERSPAFVLITGADTEQLGFEAMREGAQDFLPKSLMAEPHVLPRAIRYAIERRRIATQLARRQQEVEAFASMASHDLQSPLRRMRQAVDILLEHFGDYEDEDVQFSLNVLRLNATQLQLLVQDILTFSRLGKEALKPRRFSLARAFNRAQETFSDRITETGAIIDIDPLPSIRGDRRLIEMVLHNLLSNALKFVREMPPRIHISAQTQENQHIVRVADNGIGIPRHLQQKIFEPFRRAVNAEAFEGTGLGLATCRKILDAHNGLIWVDSELGEGATFFFSLPR